MSDVLNKPILLTDPPAFILAGCRGNDLQCQEQLYRHCYAPMIKIACRYADDMDAAGMIFNNAMLRVFKGLSSYKEQGSFMGWVKTIVINCCLDQVKQQTKFKKENSITSSDDTISLEQESIDKLSVKEIRSAIMQLPKATAIVFNLFIYEGFTHKQISAALSISEGTSKWHVNEGRRLLKIKLKDFLNQQTQANGTR